MADSAHGTTIDFFAFITDESGMNMIRAVLKKSGEKIHGPGAAAGMLAESRIR